MSIILFTLRGIRFICRLPIMFVEFLIFKFDLLINNVKHKKIKSYGIPYISVSLDSECIIGDNFTIANGTRFNPIGFPQRSQIVVVNGGKLVIGANVGISQSAIICHKSITIGDNVKIGAGVKIYDTDFHSLDYVSRRNKKKDMAGKVSLPVEIKNDVFIGAGSYILKGVSIGANSIIGAGSVVANDIPENEVWCGNPARCVRKII